VVERADAVQLELERPVPFVGRRLLGGDGQHRLEHSGSAAVGDRPEHAATIRRSQWRDERLACMELEVLKALNGRIGWLASDA
jgi:hypothetical protein